MQSHSTPNGGGTDSSGRNGCGSQSNARVVELSEQMQASLGYGYDDTTGSWFTVEKFVDADARDCVDVFGQPARRVPDDYAVSADGARWEPLHREPNRPRSRPTVIRRGPGAVLRHPRQRSHVRRAAPSRGPDDDGGEHHRAVITRGEVRS